MMEQAQQSVQDIANLLYRHRPSDRIILKAMPIDDLRKGIAEARIMCNGDECCNYRIDIAEKWVDKWEKER